MDLVGGIELYNNISQNDPLRIGAYGTKKDMREKGMIKEAERKGSKRYYPKHK